jgi:2-oxoglutarate dehydrogenase E1 component
MYSLIKNRPPVHEVYSEQLIEEGIDAEEIESRAKAIIKKLEEAYAEFPSRDFQAIQGKWDHRPHDYQVPRIETGVERQTLQALARRLTDVPEGFTPHKKIAALLEKRRRGVETGRNIDWGGGEALAFASLLAEGISIRMSGEDSCRGAFGHRHSILYDMQTEETHIPLSLVAADVARFYPWDSLLSEFAVLGFEYGYSVEALRTLVIWEAQFGDFANGAQVIIDQFIAGGESKWERASGLVMLLPHGYEGQGAEHSSARIERFLQLSADNNMQIIYPSTPAQLFHLLRRQMKQPFRKPLVVFTPKSLLRHPLCVSTLDEFAKGRFQEVIPAETTEERTTTLLLCTGKIYYDLLDQAQKKKRKDIAIVRIEQLYPLPVDLLKDAVAPYKSAGKIAWVQEEPKNMGAWSFLREHLGDLFDKEPLYIGRRENDVPAVASHRLHNREQELIIDQALAAG